MDGGLALAASEASALIADDAATRVAAPTQLSVRLTFKPGDANVTEYDIQGDEVSLGRGQQCTIVLNDKKSSRKHAILRRAGMQFTLKDLGSSNGTYIDGRKVPSGQEVEVPGEARIQIGNVEFQFKALSRDYLAQASALPSAEELAPAVMAEPAAAVPDLGQPAVSMDPMGQGGMPQAFAADAMGGVPQPVGMPQEWGAVPGMTGVPGIATPGAAAGGNPNSLLTKFRALPMQRRLIYIVGIGALLYYGVEEGYFNDFLPQPEKPAKTQQQKPVTAADAKKKATFDTLPRDKQLFVDSTHKLAYEYFQNREWDKSLYELEKIFALIPDYKDSREIERYAREAKERQARIDEENKRAEEETRAKARVASLLEQGAELVKNKDYENLRGVIAEILNWDPDNAQVAEWKKTIEEVEENKRRNAVRKQVQSEVNRRARETLDQGLALTRKGKWFASIPVFAQVIELDPADRRIIQKARTKIAQAKAWIKAKRDPLLEAALEREKGKEYGPAFKLYLEASKVDPSNKAAPQGMARVRGVLHEAGKGLYTEGVLAESYSDFTTAKQKFNEILRVVPAEDIYYERASKKLSKYHVLKDDEARE